MNKTIFNLTTKASILLIASFGILLGFLANAFYVNTFISYILYILRSALFVGVYVVIHFTEKKNKLFKDASKRMIGYLSMCYISNLLCALFSLTHILKEIFLTASGLVCFWTILVFVIEILYMFSNQKWVVKFQSFNEKIGLTFANPIVKIIENKTTND